MLWTLLGIPIFGLGIPLLSEGLILAFQEGKALFEAPFRPEVAQVYFPTLKNRSLAFSHEQRP